MPELDAPKQGEQPARQVYATTAHCDGWNTKFHIAVLRDDLHTFVIFADIPSGGTLLSFRMQAALVHEAMGLDIADWAHEHVIFGKTAWLIRRFQPGWRAVRRIVVPDGGPAGPGDWLPAVGAEPILRMLENSVPAFSTGELD